jgi:hypothetical protein
MGTDIYLNWEGKTQQDWDDQMTGWSIDAGSVGYLRASIGMITENAVLREIFPEKYWTAGSTDEFDFKGAYALLGKLGFEYLASVVEGTEMQLAGQAAKGIGEQQETAMAIHSAIMGVAESFGASGQLQVYMGKPESFSGAVNWLNSLFQFLELGIEKQKKGLKPYPGISW